MPQDTQELGTRLKQEREKASLSLAQLAELTGLSKAYLVRLENHRANPSLQVLAQIADALDLMVADLVGGRVRFDPEHAADRIPNSLQIFADDAGLTESEVRTLASIRFRRGDQPRTPQRWRYIYESLNVSRTLDESDDEAVE